MTIGHGKAVNGMTTLHAVDDARFTRPLVKALRRHVDTLAATLPRGGMSEACLGRRTRIAGAWVFASAVLAWAEDHGLVDRRLRAGLPGTGTVGERFADATLGLAVHPATGWWLHPDYNPDLFAATPSDDALAELVRWWADTAPSLAHDVDAGPPSISGWIVGDLLQLVTDDRKANALAQTPWWVADGILDLTLVPACAEFAAERLVRTIDPTCGTGHFMIRTMDYLWEWYTTGSVRRRQMRPLDTVTGGVALPPDQALPRLVASADGVEKDPLTAAVARLRCTAYAAYLRAGQPVRLDRIPRTLIPRVGVADSLLLGKISRAEYAELHPALAALPGASFTGGDWPWPDEDAPDLPPASPPAPIGKPVQLDLFGAAA
jgi:hypothetical protein